jgi:hypothetical protein
MMSDHAHYEELAALAAGGHLSDQELMDVERHAETCAECKNVLAKFQEVVRFGLPLAQSPLRRSLNMITSRPDSGARERFIRRASLEGIVFSREVSRSTALRRPRLTFAAASVGVAAAVVAGVMFLSHHRGVASPQLYQLSQQNSTLEATISRLEKTNAELQHDTEDLRARVATPTAADSSLPQRKEGSTPTDTTQLASQRSQPLEESEAQRKTQEKLLEDTRAELAGLKKARASDQASIVADQIRINELSDQLKTAKVNANLQRQVATGDVPNLMGARQLHVVDVRDSGPNGKPGRAFGRIFLTEGKSLVFYAFDLNDPSKSGSKKTYQVWGQTEGRAGSVRSLGFLNVDNKAQQRWVLKSNDAATFKEVNSLFVTVEPQGGAKTPNGQRLLFAYLGEANHP